uniref:Protein MNN4-like n=1 Tax=Angiostrongylus cantonensis TaxID=6313 RepID=A0A0K0DC07_ANGCA
MLCTLAQMLLPEALSFFLLPPMSLTQLYSHMLLTSPDLLSFYVLNPCDEKQTGSISLQPSGSAQRKPGETSKGGAKSMEKHKEKKEDSVKEKKSEMKKSEHKKEEEKMEEKKEDEHRAEKEEEKKEEKKKLDLKPKQIKRNEKEERIAQGKEVRNKGDYPTFNDVESDWDSDKEKKDKKKEGDQEKGDDKKESAYGDVFKDDSALKATQSTSTALAGTPYELLLSYSGISAEFVVPFLKRLLAVVSFRMSRCYRARSEKWKEWVPNEFNEIQRNERFELTSTLLLLNQNYSFLKHIVICEKTTSQTEIASKEAQGII